MLTDSKVRSAKPLAKSYKLTDSQGLYLTVSTRSAKLWYFRYCLGGKESRLAFGPYPQTTLAEARESAMQRDPAYDLDGVVTLVVTHQHIPLEAKHRHVSRVYTFEELKGLDLNLG